MELKRAAGLSPGEVLTQLASAPTGLSAEEAARRLREEGANAVRSHGPRPWRVLLRQLESPLLLLLVSPR